MGEVAPALDELKGLSEDSTKRRTSSRISGQKRPFYGNTPPKSVTPDAKDENVARLSCKKRVLNGSSPRKRILSDAKDENVKRLSVKKSPFKLSTSWKTISSDAKGENGGIRKVSKPKKTTPSKKRKRIVVEDNEEIDVGNADILVKNTIRLYQKYYLQDVAEKLKCQNDGSGKNGVADSTKTRRGGKNGCRRDGSGKRCQRDGNGVADSTKARRPDLRALSKMVTMNEALYRRKRFGNLPGIPVGFQFFSRAEMAALGIHSHWLKGIDYMTESDYGKLPQYKKYCFPLAVSIVVSGMYEDDKDSLEEVVYTGEGGNDLLGKKQQIADQKMIRGNLALKNSMEQKIPIRVIRGNKSTTEGCYLGKLFTYDGLYEVKKCWKEKGQSGFIVFKFQLNRIEGQPPLTTNQVNYIHAQPSQSQLQLIGKVCDDISEGQERIKVAAYNLVDDPPVGPTGYTYCKSVRVVGDMILPQNGTGCSCEGACTDAKKCACAKLNGSEPYVDVDGGRLIEAKTVVFECGPNCKCGPKCVNRTSQKGLRFRLEVFRTTNKGWALRSRDFIPAGAPVCEYTGTLMRTKDMNNASENDYIFEIDCLETMEGLDGRESRAGVVPLPSKRKNNQSEPEFCIDAGTYGGVARFINHSCGPNLFVQCVLSSHHDIRLARVMLFAADNILPLQELTYDYGYALDSVIDKDGNPIAMPCHCGAIECRKRLY